MTLARARHLKDEGEKTQSSFLIFAAARDVPRSNCRFSVKVAVSTMYGICFSYVFRPLVVDRGLLKNARKTRRRRSGVKLAQKSESDPVDPLFSRFDKKLESLLRK